MIDAMVMTGKKGGKYTDVNVDDILAGFDKTVPAGTSKQASTALSITGSASAVIGYWAGQLHLVGAGGVQLARADTVAGLGWANNLSGQKLSGVTMALNTCSYQHKQFLYFGLGRSPDNGVVRRYDMVNRTYYTFPTAPVSTGILYADDQYLYIFAAVGSSGLLSKQYCRIAIGDTNWGIFTIGNGAFTHGVAGGEATLVGSKVYFTGGGQRMNSTDSADGGSYTVIEHYDFATDTVGRNTIASPGIVVNGTAGTDQPSCVWNDSVYYAAPGTAVSIYPLNGGARSQVTGATTNYHSPCMRVGNFFYYMAGYSNANVNMLKLPGGL